MFELYNLICTVKSVRKSLSTFRRFMGWGGGGGGGGGQICVNTDNSESDVCTRKSASCKMINLIICLIRHVLNKTVLCNK